MSDPESKLFAIFHFAIDDSVEVIPVNWIIWEDGKTRAYFPNPGIKGYKKMVKNLSVPDEESFTKFDGRVLSYYGSYDDAMSKINLARVQSDLETTPSSKSRKKTVNVLPAAPSHVLQLVTSETETAKTSESLPASSGVMDVILPENLGSEWNVNQPSSADVSLSQFNFFEENHMREDATSASEVFQKDVMSMLHDIRSKQDSQQKLLEAIINKLEVSPGALGAGSFKLDQFPIKTMEDLIQFNSRLEEEKEVYDSLVRRLRADATGTTVVALRSHFRLIFTDDLLSSHNYRGQSNKTSLLKHPALVHALKDALKDNAKITDYSITMFDQAIQQLLKQTSDRVRERKKQAALRQPESTTPGNDQ